MALPAAATMASVAAEAAPKVDANDYSRFEALDDPDEESFVQQAVAAKGAGNQKFKAADFKGAAEAYGEALALLKQEEADTTKLSGEVRSTYIAVRSNRAQCYLNLRNFKRAIEDCDAVLKLDKTHTKALYRRGIAHKSKDKEELAYRDFLLLLDIDPTNKKALREKTRIGKSMHPRSRQAIRDRIDRDNREAEKKAREAEEKARRKAAEKSNRETAAVKSKNGASSTDGANSDQKHDHGGGPPPKMSASTRKPGSEKADVVKEKSEELMRGYKRTKDGRTTSYFTREIDDEAKSLIGDIAPKRLDLSATNSSSAAATKDGARVGSSAWNKAGTWEEVDKSAWCEAKLKEVLGGIEVEAGGSVAKVTGVKNIKGDGQILVLRGRPRFIWDYSFDLKWDVKVMDSGKVVKGTLHYEDFSQSTSEPPTVSRKYVKKPSDKKLQDAAERGTASLRAKVSNALSVFADAARAVIA